MAVLAVMVTGVTILRSSAFPVMTMQPAARVTLHTIPDQPCPADQEVFISLPYLLSADLDTDITKILSLLEKVHTLVTASDAGLLVPAWLLGRGGGGITRLLRIRSHPGYNPYTGRGHVSPAQPRVSSMGATRVLARVLNVAREKVCSAPKGMFYPPRHATTAAAARAGAVQVEIDFPCPQYSHSVP